MTEQEAEAEVLRICRTGRRKDGKTAQNGVWCMREINPKFTKHDPAKGLRVVIDNARWDSPLMAQGHTWAEVLEKLP